MASDSASPEGPSRASTGARDHQAEEAQTPERYAVVELTRHVKDDGRALLLYTRVPDDAA